MNNLYTTYGRIRPLHTNAVIFAFVGNAIFMGAYYSLQRLPKTRMFNDTLSDINFWGWQLIILAAVIRSLKTLPHLKNILTCRPHPLRRKAYRNYLKM